MNTLDIIIVILILWGFYKGFRKGLIIELASLMALWAGVYGGIKFSDFAARFLEKTFSWHSSHVRIIAFAILFLGILAFVFFIAKITERFVKIILLNWMNRLLGALFGGLKFALFISVLFFILHSFEQKLNFVPQNTKTSSVLYSPVSKLAPAIIPVLKPLVIHRS
ncbi:MAG: CvpA family protein [Bacteroidia bacterium]